MIQIYAEKFAEEVESISGGKMKIQVRANSKLGEDQERLKSCMNVDITFVVHSTASQADLMPNLAVFDLPCVFDSMVDCRKKLDDPAFYSLISEVYTKCGCHLLGMADQGLCVMSTNQSVTSSSDFTGQKIRTPDDPYSPAFWEALGASPTHMDFSRVYTGLQEHIIDGQESSFEDIVSNHLYEQQDYIVETNHLPQMISLIVYDEFYSNLSESEKFIMDEAAATAVEYARQASDERILNYKDIIEKSGTKILALDDDTRAAVRTASESVYRSIQGSISARIYDAYIHN